MTMINLDEALWQNSMLPEGILERWLVDNGTKVTAGERIAEVRIESSLHEIMAPVGGILAILAEQNTVVEPGTTVGRVLYARGAGR
jgi:pyruvate/2-oxoglutarate dehydrogenase complex dihydrolipoamide acyltransferase (E2) component